MGGGKGSVRREFNRPRALKTKLKPSGGGSNLSHQDYKLRGDGVSCKWKSRTWLGGSSQPCPQVRTPKRNLQIPLTWTGCSCLFPFISEEALVGRGVKSSICLRRTTRTKHKNLWGGRFVLSFN